MADAIGKSFSSILELCLSAGFYWGTAETIKYTYLSNSYVFSNTSTLAELLAYEVAGANGGWALPLANRAVTPGPTTEFEYFGVTDLTLTILAQTVRFILFYDTATSKPICVVDLLTAGSFSSGATLAGTNYFFTLNKGYLKG